MSGAPSDDGTLCAEGGLETHAEPVRAGREVINGSVDGFHRPKAVRYQRGRFSAAGYYHDARDLDAVRRLLLNPLGPGGDRVYRLASFDLDLDIPIDAPSARASTDAILLLDGSFLQRPALRPALDLVIFLYAELKEANARGIERDKLRYGPGTDVEMLYELRYNPAFEMYRAECRPDENADIVIDNSNPTAPVLLRYRVGKTRPRSTANRNNTMKDKIG
ncbi:uridylate kinase [Paraburkholderia bengalensis]|uniref:Uridylate kinase n=1 Tax=Paraburkholderia bengalensis TaxID=2747562 RepID=A0ABU8J1I3_9BURK